MPAPVMEAPAPAAEVHQDGAGAVAGASREAGAAEMRAEIATDTGHAARASKHAVTAPGGQPTASGGGTAVDSRSLETRLLLPTGEAPSLLRSAGMGPPPAVASETALLLARETAADAQRETEAVLGRWRSSSLHASLAHVRCRLLLRALGLWHRAALRLGASAAIGAQRRQLLADHRLAEARLRQAAAEAAERYREVAEACARDEARREYEQAIVLAGRAVRERDAFDSRRGEAEGHELRRA